MDDPSRALYRDAISDIARDTGRSELQIASDSLNAALSAEASDDPAITYLRQIGYYLIDTGKAIHYNGMPRNPLQWLQEWLLRSPSLRTLLAMKLGVSSLATFVFAFIIRGYSLPLPILAACYLCTYFLAVQSLSEVLNLPWSHFIPKRQVPRLLLSGGVTSMARTAVVVPVLLVNRPQVQRLVKKLENHYLTAKDHNVFCTLLTDLPDSPSQQSSEEEIYLVQQCKEAIKELNRRYAIENNGPFFMCHRDRIYSASQACWMGWERKRGKMQEFHELVINSRNTFSFIVGDDLNVLTSLRYIYLVDEDATITHGSIHRMVATLSHPLNVAQLAPGGRDLDRGMGIIHPRLGVTDASAARWKWPDAFLPPRFEDHSRVPPRRNVLQDVSCQSPYYGKGCYAVRVFHEVLGQRLPLDRVLTHDAIEGAYMRPWSADDVLLLEEAPSTYSIVAQRFHRWTRGDWQNLLWIAPRSVDQLGRTQWNGVPLVHIWLLIDKLCRSLVGLFLCVLFIVSWTRGPRLAIETALFLYALITAQSYWVYIWQLHLEVKAGKGFKASVHRFWFRLRMVQITVFVRVALATHQGMLAAAAIATSLWRLCSHRRLLEWESVAQVECAIPSRTVSEKCFIATYLLCSFLILVLTSLNARVLLVALPVILSWASSQYLSEWLTSGKRI